MLKPLSPLTVEEERALIAQAQAGDQDAVATLVRSQVRSLQSDARKYAAAEPLIQAEDLVSAGIEALMEAIRTYDLTRTTRLWSHARASIAEAMAEEVATTGRTMTVPGRTLRKYRRAIRETETIEEARALAQSRDRMDPETFDAVHFAMTGSVPLDAPAPSGATPITNGAALNGGEGDSWGGGGPKSPANLVSTESSLLGSRGQSPEGTALSRSMARQALAGLDARSRSIVALAYLSDEDLSDGDIAQRLGLSRPTVTRTRNAALATMRDLLA